jgi:hypothetical protein
MSQSLPVAVPPPKWPATDCRVYERKSCSLPTTCQPASALEMKEMRWAGTICDISQGGVRLLLSRRFEKGTGLAIELPGDSEHEPAVVFVKVIHIHREENGAWSMGCKFVSDLSEDEVDRLLTATSHVLGSSKPPERRQEPEDLETSTLDDIETPAPIPEFLSNVSLRVETRSGSHVDCVINRLHVGTSWPLSAGKLLSVHGKADDGAPWSLRIQIAHCRQDAEGWQIDGRLITAAEARNLLIGLGRGGN